MILSHLQSEKEREKARLNDLVVQYRKKKIHLYADDTIILVTILKVALDSLQTSFKFTTNITCLKLVFLNLNLLFSHGPVH